MSLDSVIAESPYKLLNDTFWMYATAASAATVAEPAGELWSITGDSHEGTKLVASEAPPQGFTEGGYGPLRGFRLRVSKPFAAPGFLAAACSALANRQIAILVLSTFSYDYVFVKADRVADAEAAFKERGFSSE
jgi:hypothetical protein